MQVKKKRFKHDICILGLKCYDHLVGKDVPRYLGGIEKQLTHLARVLVQRGYRVAFITFDEGQEDGMTDGGVTLFKSFCATSGIPILRSAYPRFWKIRAAMKRADAAVYLQMGAGIETAWVAWGTRTLSMVGRRFVFAVASDKDCQSQAPHLTSVMERKGYLMGLQSSKVVLAQTQTQAEKLKTNFGIVSHITPLPHKGITEGLRTQRSDGPELKKGNILWVGRICPEKRPLWLVDIAQSLPECRFHVVGSSNRESDYSGQFLDQARQQMNIIVHGRISDEDLNDLYDRVDLLICTSEIEGFPTTFLEAWSRGIPVVTSFDPDGTVVANRLGKAVGELGQFPGAIKSLLEDPQALQTVKTKCQDYFQSVFGEDKVIRDFERCVFEM